MRAQDIPNIGKPKAPEVTSSGKVESTAADAVAKTQEKALVTEQNKEKEVK